jgi:hypothetical protein
MVANRKPARPGSVLFLDYDGTVHRGATYIDAHSNPVAASDVVLFEFAGILDRLLRPYPALKLVLSTDWVPVFGVERALAALPLASLRERVIGATYDPGEVPIEPEAWRTLWRGVQVRGYLDRHPCKRWLALDDRKDGFERHRKHLVLCQEDVGLGDRDVQLLLAKRLAEMHESMRGGHNQ